MARLREREQEAAAYVMGVKRVAFLRHPDAELVEDLELREEFVREIRATKPDVLITFDPNVGYRYHPDHRVVGRVADRQPAHQPPRSAPRGRCSAPTT